MGTHINTLDFFWESVKSAGIENLKGKQMLELGNQIMRQDTKNKYKFSSGYSKVYFLNLRCHHTAIDWNCEDGAVPIDMCKPIPIERYINNFDIITDFGCMEHYWGDDKKPKKWGLDKEMIAQWQSWKNIHDMGKVGCVYIHTLPFLGSVPWHGLFHYDLNFFEQLRKHNNYELISSHVQKCDTRSDKRDYAFSAYIKKEDKSFAPEWNVFKGWLHR